MKLRAKILPKYFDQIKAGTKVIDYRQVESIIFVNAKTGAEIECEVRGLRLLPSQEYAEVIKNHPDIKLDESFKIYKIFLGKITKKRL